MAGEIVRPYDQPFIDDSTSDENDQESLDSTSDEDDQESLKANRMSLPIISSKETIENQIEGNGKRIASVKKELNPKAETTIVKKKDIEEKVQRNMERIECLEKELNLKAETTILKKKDIEEEVQRNTKRIECLELDESKGTRVLKDEIEALKKKNRELEKKLQEMEKELQEMRESLKKIEKEKDARIEEIEKEKDARIEEIEKEKDARIEEIEKEKDARIEKLEKEKDARIEKLEKDRAYDQSVLILMQIGTTLQRNRCKYVLGKYFKEAFFYKYKEIDHYIKRFVPASDQESAKRRLKELEEKFPWDQDLVNSLKTLNGTRNNMAHPKLSSEKIQQATEHLRGMNKITDEMVENIMELKALWETSEDLLRSTVRSRTRREIRRSPPISQKKHVRKRAAPKDDSKSKECQPLIKKAKTLENKETLCSRTMKHECKQSQQRSSRVFQLSSLA